MSGGAGENGEPAWLDEAHDEDSMRWYLVNGGCSVLTALPDVGNGHPSYASGDSSGAVEAACSPARRRLRLLTCPGAGVTPTARSQEEEEENSYEFAQGGKHARYDHERG